MNDELIAAAEPVRNLVTLIGVGVVILILFELFRSN